ncbi:hypothetical protein ABPG74_012032 [Tetrahymena malaccensis]
MFDRLQQNQYLDPQTQICNDYQNNFSEFQSVTKCTSCTQDYHFVSEKKEACRKCFSNEQNHILSRNYMCKYDNRYEFYEFTGLNKLDDSCEKKMQQRQIRFWYEIQQQIGNSYMLQHSLKTLSLGPTFYEQNF